MLDLGWRAGIRHVHAGRSGFSDFAGSGIVHMCGCRGGPGRRVILLGRTERQVRPQWPGFCDSGLPTCRSRHAGYLFILWLGWFGFNGGSELKLSNVDEANAVAQVFINTNIAACGGLVGALLLSQLLFGKADLTMALNGALAGLVSITADPLSPSAFLALAIGIGGGLLVVGSIVFLDKLKLDDPVGAISVHGTCGIFGVLAVLLSNSEATLGGQLTGLAGIFAWAFGASLIVWLILKAVTGIRISEEDEFSGADISECGIEAYPEFKNAA